MNQRRKSRAAAKVVRGPGAAAWVLVLLAACGNLEIGSFGDTTPDASVPEAGAGGESGGSAGTNGDSGGSAGTSGESGGSAGTNGDSGGSTGTGGGAAGSAGTSGESGGSAGTGGGAAGSAGSGSSGGPTGGTGPSDDVRGRAAVDGFFDPPPATAFVLPAGTIAEQRWRYTFDAPPTTWIEPSFDDSSYRSGFTGFFFGSSMPEDRPRTPWPEDSVDLWARTTFTIASPEAISEVVFWGRWDDGLEIYLNGVRAASEPEWSNGYRYLGLHDAARAALRVGSNTIAVHVADTGDGKYFDLGVVRNGRLTTRPRSGFERTPALAVYGDTVERFMLEHGIPAGVIAVMKRDTIVVSRGFGWSNKAMTTPIAEDAVLRIPILDSLITRAAVRTLIDSDDSLTDDTALFPLLADRGLTPAGDVVSNDLVNDVTLRHLMWHEDGLPALPSPPQFYQELRISAEQVTIDDPVRWVYGKGPEIVPGACPSPEACGPASDLVLRYSIHVLEGDLLTYLREVVSSSDVFLAHERLAGRSAREPGYFTLESPYDRWVYLEGQTHLAATAPALVRFSRGYHLAFGTPLIDPLTGAWSSKLDNGTHAYLGGYEGTFNLLLQRRADEVSIAVIFNIAGNYSSLVDELDAVTISDSEWGL